MITNPDVLTPDVQPPRELIVHRNSEINHLTSIFEPVTQGLTTSGAFIHGPPGSGKTCAARVLLKNLPAEVDPEYVDGGKCPPIETAYIDCYNGKSRRQVYQELLEELGDGPAETRRSIATDELQRRTRTLIDGYIVVLLDEADQIGEKAVLKELYEMTGVVLLPVVNETHHLFADAEDRLDSRLTSLTPVPFKCYDESTLVEILQARVDAGLEPGVVDQTHLETIASRSKNDARRAIAILNNAVETARGQNASELTMEIIDQATPMSEPDVIRSHLSALSRTQRICLETIAEIGPAKSGAIQQAYSSDERVDEARSQRMVRDWLSEFEDRKLVRPFETCNGPKYEVREHVREELDVKRETA
ncbi:MULTISPECIES: Cdc6/Cdc18 family protein [Halobacteriales]|uniref:Cdc6-related protein, AAA superfamily ATPase n=2 Tax=Halobacteriales TaxID=2235 RepID=A0A1I0QYV7_9EURY|nr:Cdc6/Cdc18 family protein [Natrinema salifodinae]SEW32819.1 Cdc6-related protein, AAA superfamily ATPase [Natrinema salifodinae]